MIYFCQKLVIASYCLQLPFGMVMAQKNYNSGGNSYQLNKYL